MAAAEGAGGAEGFVGRTSELGLLDAELQHVRRGDSRVVLLEGAPGIGKTSLLRRFLGGLADLAVVAGSGDEGEARLPFGVVAQLVQGIGGLGGGEPPRLAPPPGEDPLVVGAALVQVLGAIGTAGPVAVVVDDAQWADTASLQALTFALRRLRADPVLALVVARDRCRTIPDGLRRLSGERGRRLGLGGLTAEDLAPLAERVTGDAPPRRVLERLHEHTGGNPLHVRALLEELDPSELAGGSRLLPAPRSFAAVIGARVDACSADARALIEGASVLGSRCAVGAAARVAGLANPVDALEEATGTGILEMVETAAGPAVAFSHPLVRAAIYHDLGPARSSALHARAASCTDGSSRLDHRIAAAVVEDPDLAAEVATHARQEVVRGAVLSAAAYLVDGARLSLDRRERERLLLDAVEQLLFGGEVAEAARLAGELQALPDSPRRRYLLGHLAFLRGRRREAEELLVGAWERCQAVADDELGPLVSLVLARLCSTELRLDEAVEWSRRATGGDARRAMARALGVLVPCLGAAGLAEEGLALAASLPDGVPLSERDIEGVLGRGLVRMWVDDLPGASADLSAVVAATRSRPACASSLIALGFLAEAEYRLGAWDDSVAHGDLAVSLACDSDQVWLTGFVHAGASWALAARGDWAAAQDHVRGALGAAAALGDPTSVTCAAMAGVNLAFTRADHPAVLEAVQPLLDLGQRTSLAEPSVRPWRELHAEALVNLGRLDEAEEALVSLEELARKRGRRSSLTHAARVRGALEAARGDASRARAAFEAGLAHCCDLPTPFDRALVELAYGRFLRRAGERRAAADHLAEAHAAFDHLGADPFLRRCGAELAGCGLSPRRRTPSAQLCLTPQELAVAKLVTAGSTNREVAAELVVSVKTVEYHLGNLFSRLGITSRRQLAARLSAPDFAPDLSGDVLHP